jgi:hypothetical protein
MLDGGPMAVNFGPYDRTASPVVAIQVLQGDCLYCPRLR